MSLTMTPGRHCEILNLEDVSGFTVLSIDQVQLVLEIGIGTLEV